MTRALRTALLLVCFVLPASPAAAATFTVSTTADTTDVNPGNGVCAASNGLCTLRAALGEANTLAGSDTIVLPAGTYQLDDGLGQLAVSSTVVVVGAGARSTLILAGANSRVLNVTANLTLRGVTVANGSPKGAGAVRGGGINIVGGDVTLERVTVRNNTVASETNANGGGVAADGGSLIILDSTISNNLAVGRVGNSGGGSGSGGGIAAAAPTTIRRSTITSNTTQNYGAGMFSSGGGIHVGDNMVLDHVTLVGNVASSFADSSGFRQGGNMYIPGYASVSMRSSIMAGGSAASGGNNCFAYGTFTEPARNLSDNFDCMGAGSLRNVAPKLGALQNNGGGTDTRLPALDSPAVDAATGCGTRPADQRGNDLPAGPACDLGAVEIGADRSVTLQASKSAAGAGDDVTLIATISNANDGADDATGETLTLDLPAGVTATTATSTIGSCATGASVTCSFGTLARGQAATIIATVRANGESFGVTARRGGSLPDQSVANDAASIAVAGIAAGPGTAPTPGGGTGGGTTGTGGSGPARDTSAPVLSALKLAPKATVRRGATLRFRLSEAATVRIVTERLVKGRKSGARCAAKGRGKACTRVLKASTRTVRLKAGSVSVKLPGKALKAGKLRFTVVATDGAGNASKAARVSGSVKRR